MKNLILLLLVTFSLLSCAQNNTLENTNIRAQGYLFTITTLKKPVNAGADSIFLDIDRPKRFFFIPVADMKTNLQETLETLKTVKSNSLFLPLTLTGSKRSIQSTNSNLKSYLKNNDIKLVQLDEHENFQNKPKTVFRAMNDDTKQWVYEIVYIDGLWEKVEVPFKWSEVISIGNYRSNSLNKENKNTYNYYFLKNINIISYNLDIKEEGIVILNTD